MTQPQQPGFTVTQPKIALVLSLVTVVGLVYAGTEKIIRRDFEFKELKTAQATQAANYAQLTAGQAELRAEVKSLRQTVNGEIRNMSAAINRLSKVLEGGEAEQ